LKREKQERQQIVTDGLGQNFSEARMVDFVDRKRVEALFSKGWGKPLRVDVIKRNGSLRSLVGVLRGFPKRWVIIEVNRLGQETIKRVNLNKVVEIRWKNWIINSKGTKQMITINGFTGYKDLEGWIELD
jgi:hypothetical protein